MDKKDVVAGLGEIGTPILQTISKGFAAVGYDLNPKLMNEKRYKRYEKLQTCLLHICIPFTDNFINNVISLSRKFNPEGIVIHSTISPGTTAKIQSKVSVPVIYSATRGVHKRMLYDLRRYTKFFAIEPNAPNREWAVSTFTARM